MATLKLLDCLLLAVVSLTLTHRTSADDAFWEDVEPHLLLPEPIDLRRDLASHEHTHLPERPEEFRLIAHSADAIQDALRSATTKAGVLPSLVDEERDVPFSIPLPNGANADVACFASNIVPQSLLKTMGYHFGTYICSGGGVMGHFSLSDANGIRGLFTHHRADDDTNGVSFQVRSVDPHDRLPVHPELGSHRPLAYSFWSQKSRGGRNYTQSHSRPRGTCETDHSMVREEDVDGVLSRRASIYSVEFTLEENGLAEYVLLMGTTPETFSDRFNNVSSNAIEFFGNQLATINAVFNRELGVHWVMSASSIHAINSSAHATLPPEVDTSGEVFEMSARIPSFLQTLKNIKDFRWEHHHAAIYLSSAGGGVVTDINGWCEYSGAVIGMAQPTGQSAETAFNLGHELGHLLGMHHTFTGDGLCEQYVDRVGAAVEPLSGNTLMAYPDFRQCDGGGKTWQMDPSKFERNYFHSVNYQQYLKALEVPKSYTSWFHKCHSQPFYSTFPFQRRQGNTLATSTPEITLNPPFTLPANGKYYLGAEVKTKRPLGLSTADPLAHFAWEQSDRLGGRDAVRGISYAADNMAMVSSKRQGLRSGELESGEFGAVTAARFVPEIPHWDTDVTAENEWARSPRVGGNVHFNFMLVGDDGHRAILRNGMSINVRPTLAPLVVRNAKAKTNAHVVVSVDPADSSDSKYDVYLSEIARNGGGYRKETLIGCNVQMKPGNQWAGAKAYRFCLPKWYNADDNANYIRVVNTNAKQPYYEYTEISPALGYDASTLLPCRFIGCGSGSDGERVTLSQSVKDFMIKKMDEFRANVSPPPRNMPKLGWSDQLANEWDRNVDNRCNFVDPNPYANGRHTRVKRVITATSDEPINAEFLLNEYLDETLVPQRLAFDFQRRECARGSTCDLYTQFVQDTITEVGCTVMDCSNAGGHGTPYTKGGFGGPSQLKDIREEEKIYLMVCTFNARNWKDVKTVVESSGLGDVQIYIKPPYAPRRALEGCEETCESKGFQCGSFTDSCGNEIQCSATCPGTSDRCSDDNVCIDCCANKGCGQGGEGWADPGPGGICSGVYCGLCPYPQACNTATNRCENIVDSSAPEPSCERDLPSWKECGSIKGLNGERIPCKCGPGKKCRLGKCRDSPCGVCEWPRKCARGRFGRWKCRCAPPYRRTRSGRCIKPTSVYGGGLSSGGTSLSYGNAVPSCGGTPCSRRSTTAKESLPIILPWDGTDELYDYRWTGIESSIMIPEQNETATVGIAMHIGDVLHDGVPDHVSFAIRVSPIDGTATYHVQATRKGKQYDLTKHLEVETFERRGDLLPPTHLEAGRVYRMEMVSGVTNKGRTRYVYLYVDGQPVGGLALPKEADMPAGPAGAYISSGQATWSKVVVRTYDAVALDFAECLSQDEIRSVVSEALEVVDPPEIIVSGAYNRCTTTTRIRGRGEEESARTSSARQSASTPVPLSGATVTLRSTAGVPSWVLADRLSEMANTGGTARLSSAGPTSVTFATPSLPAAPSLLGAAPAGAMGLASAAGLSAGAIAGITLATIAVATLALGTLVVAGALGSVAMLAAPAGAVGALAYVRNKRAARMMQDDNDPEEPNHSFPMNPYKPRGGVKLDDYNPTHKKSISGRVPTLYVPHQTTHVHRGDADLY